MTRQMPLRHRRLTTCRALISACALFLAAPARAGNLRIENVKVAARDAKSATVTFDVSWTNSWRHGSFHDAVWVFFKARGDKKSCSRRTRC